MSKLWYPMINQDKSIGCMTCCNKCIKGVL